MEIRLFLTFASLEVFVRSTSQKCDSKYLKKLDHESNCISDYETSASRQIFTHDHLSV